MERGEGLNAPLLLSLLLVKIVVVVRIMGIGPIVHVGVVVRIVDVGPQVQFILAHVGSVWHGKLLLCSWLAV